MKQYSVPFSPLLYPLHNLVIDHVGIVEKVEGNYVYSIEGNVGKVNVQRRKSKLNSYYIYAYGVPDYSN